MILLDLFSGIGGFTLGFQQAGFNVERHYYSEIDKYAIANYSYNFKNSGYVGEVSKIEKGTMERPNVITFGSPCQDFSVAGQRAGLSGERSVLIQEAIRIVAIFRPDIFIWENVKGVFSSNNRADFWAVIQAFTNIGGYRLEWQLLNTAWFLPQNRERIYLIGHLAESGRNFRQVFPIGQGNQFNDEIQSIEGGEGARSSCLNVRYGQRWTDETYIKVNQPKIFAQRGRGENNEQQLEQRDDKNTNTLTGVQKDNLVVIGNVYNGNAQAGKVYNPINSNAPTVSGQRINSQGFIQVEQKPTRWQRTKKGKQERKKNMKEGKDYTPFSDGARELKPTNDNNIGCITNAVNKDTLIQVENLIPPFVVDGVNDDGFEIGHYQVGDYRNDEGLRIRKDNNSPTISARAREDGSGQGLVFVGGINEHNRGNGTLSRDYSLQSRVYDAETSMVGATVSATMQSKYLENKAIRRLTPIECERLQGFPDNFTEFGNYNGEIKKIADTQRYKMLGNAVTVKVVEEVAKRLLKIYPQFSK